MRNAIILIAVVAAAGQVALAGGAIVTRSDQLACWFTVQVPAASLSAAGEGRTMVDIEGFAPGVAPGRPAAPSRYVFVAVPEGARVSVRSEPGGFEEHQGIKLAPQPRLVPGGEQGMGRLEYAEDLEAYSRPGLAPAPQAELVAVEPLRQLTVARIRINPVQYDPVAGRLRIFRSIKVMVGWDPPTAEGAVYDPAFERAYSSLLLNFDQARNWARKPPPSPPKDVDPFDQSARWFRIPVVKEGMYRLDHGYLTRQGIDPATVDPRTIKLFNGGSRALPKAYDQAYPDTMTQVAIWVRGEGDGRFDPGDEIIFYGRDLAGWEKNSLLATPQFRNPYCDTNVYWLGWGGAGGLRMEAFDGEPSDPTAHVPASFTDTVHAESDVYNPFNSGEIWYWVNMQRGNTEQTKAYNLTFQLPGAAAGDCQVKLSYREAKSGWHRLRWGMNGEFTRDLRWYGDPLGSDLSDTSSFSAAAASNSLNLELVKATADTSDGIHLNWFEISYRRNYRAENRSIKFRVDSTGHLRHRVRLTGLASDSAIILDITDPERPGRIVSSRVYPAYAEFEDAWRPGNRYLAAAPEAWLAPAAATEYTPQHLRSSCLDARFLLIVPDEMWTVAQRLASHHGVDAWLQPLRLAKLSWVYNEFGFGLRQPAAVRNFLKYVYLASNRTCPAYCLLFGNGNYDYKHLDKSTANTNYISTYQGDALNFLLKEYHFGAYDDWFAHFETSLYPQLSLARLPAMSLSEANTMVDKIIGYRTSLGTWRNRIVLMSDDNIYEGSPNYYEWVHNQQTEALSNLYLPHYFDRRKVYGGEYTLTGGEKPAAREALKEAWVDGACIVNFIGHGSYFVWGHEQYLRGEDVPYLSCGDKLPFVLTASCAISRFDRINYRCINSALVALSGGGAIATLGDMREGESGGNFAFNWNVYTAIFQDSLDLGQSVFTAKYRTQYVASNNQPYVLLGDPGIHLGSPKAPIAMTPSSDTLLGRGRYQVRGAVGRPWAAGSGQVLVRVFDIPTFVDSSGIDYYQPGKVVAQGMATVAGDSFVFNFNVPDMYYAAPRAGCRISAYAWGGGGDGAGATTDTIWLGGLDTMRVNDHAGPAISLWAGETEVTEGDYVSGTDGLSVRISDPLGVNIVPGVPEGEIRAWLDNEPYQDLGQSFVYDLDSDSSGSAEYSPRLSQGGHVLAVRAYDCFGNYTTLRRSFRIADESSSLEMVYNYPNPATNGTHFTFQLPMAADITIKIFTVAGRLVKTIDAPGLGAGYRQVFWDCRDESGDGLSNGVYLYKVSMRGEGREESKYSKIVIMR